MRAHRDELIQKGILLPDLANATSPTNGSSQLPAIAGKCQTTPPRSYVENETGNRFITTEGGPTFSQVDTNYLLIERQRELEKRH